VCDGRATIANNCSGCRGNGGRFLTEELTYSARDGHYIE